MHFLRIFRFPQANYLHAKRLYSKIINDSNDPKRKSIGELYSKFFELGPHKVNVLLSKYPSLWSETTKIEEIKASAEFLKQQNLSTEEILSRPNCLLINKLTLANRARVLKECCFIDLKVIFFYNFVTIINKKISLLKDYNYIDQNSNVHERLLSFLDIPVTLTTELSDDMQLNEVRKIIKTIYLKTKLEMTEEELTKLWKIYGSRLKNRNLESIVKVINILENQLEFSKKRIVNNGFLLYACPDNLVSMLNMPPIGDVSFKEIILQRPKIVMQQVQSVIDIINQVKSFDIPEDRITKSLDILTLSANTVKERIDELSKISEFNVLISNPRVLRLIHFQNKAKTRLDYLKQLKLKCVSLDVLTGPSENFEKFAKEGVDKTKGKDTVNFLAKTFKLDLEGVKNTLSRHPYSYHIPVISIKVTIDYLRYNKFTDQEIAENIYLVLYPISRVDQKLSSLLKSKEENDGSRLINGVSLAEMSNSTLLNLCLYYIEAEFHFTGDGVWDLNRQSIKSDEIFPTTIPEFPKTLSKENKFGKKMRKI